MGVCATFARKSSKKTRTEITSDFLAFLLGKHWRKRCFFGQAKTLHFFEKTQV